MTIQSRHKLHQTIIATASATNPSSSHHNNNDVDTTTSTTSLEGRNGGGILFEHNHHNNTHHNNHAYSFSSSPSKAMKRTATSCFSMAIMMIQQRNNVGQAVPVHCPPVTKKYTKFIFLCIGIAGIIYIGLYSRISSFLPQIASFDYTYDEQQPEQLRTRTTNNYNTSQQPLIIQQHFQNNPIRKPLHKSDIVLLQQQEQERQRRVVVLDDTIDMEESFTTERRKATFPSSTLTIDKDEIENHIYQEQHNNNNNTNSSDRSIIYPYEKPYLDECQPMAEWQTQFYPTCNTIHEHSLVSDYDDDDVSNKKSDNDHSGDSTHLLSMMGYWRMVWKVPLVHHHRHHQDEQHVVLKMLHLHRDFNTESYHLNQVDSIAMERLTFSPYVINEYGFCGQTVVTEYGIGEARAALKDNKAKSDHRLKYARDLALGLNDIHSLTYPHGTNATFAHNDVNIANMVLGANKKLKYNDFNIGILMKWNTSSSQPCGFPVKFGGTPLWRSPEEIKNTTYVSEKVDIYALGNVLFQVLTKHQPWTWLEPNGRPSYEEVLERKVNGDVPHLPPKYKETTSAAALALQAAIYSCFNPNPEERPTAYQLANGFQQVLTWRKEKASINMTDLVSLFFTDTET